MCSGRREKVNVAIVKCLHIGDVLHGMRKGSKTLRSLIAGRLVLFSLVLLPAGG